MQSPGISDWAVQTREELSADEWEKDSIISRRIGIDVLGNVVPGAKELSSFPAYLYASIETEPQTLRDRIVFWKVKSPNMRLNLKTIPEVDDSLTLLESREAFFTFSQHPLKDKSKREEISRIYDLFTNTEALKSLLVSYLQYFWDRYLHEEW